MTAARAAVLDAGITLALAEVVGRGVVGSVPGKPAAVAFAAAAVIVALALDTGQPASLAAAAVRSAGIGASAVALALAHAGGRVGPGGALGIGVAVGAITLAGGGATRLAATVLGNAARGRLAVAVVLGWAATAPVWLGPAIERIGAPEPALDAIVAASPLTYLAAMAGYEYLHQPWFYVRSPVASLRFTYPAATVLTVCWLAVGTLLLHAPRMLPERWR